MTVRVADEIRSTLAQRQPVVALESTIFSPLGLPAPHNTTALDRCLAAVRAGGAVPAISAVLDGVVRVGLEPAEHERILGGGIKVAERDLPVAMAHGEAVGVTTVSASLALAAATGIRVFATGGIGGVHRDATRTGDVSADLVALATHPVVTVSAGVKAFLDIPRTLEHLETAGVPVLGWRTDEFPMFWSTTSGVAVQRRVEDAEQVAHVVLALEELGLRRGVLVAVPVPGPAAIPRDTIDAAIQSALAAAAAERVTGAAVTPRVLAAIERATEGRSVPANVALAEHNCAVAAEIAVGLAAIRGV